MSEQIKTRMIIAQQAIADLSITAQALINTKDVEIKQLKEELELLKQQIKDLQKKLHK